MFLVPRVRHHFAPRIQRRGESYARARRVAVVAAGDGAARVEVSGSEFEPYAVEVRPLVHGRGAALGVSCSCPHFEGGEWCKHLWATLLALDAGGWKPPALAGGPARLRLAALDAGAFDDDEPAYAPSAPGLRPRPAFTIPAQGWRARVDRLGSESRRRAAGAGASRSPAALAGFPLCYLIDADEVRREGALRIRFFRRSLRKDGSLGGFRPARLALDDAGLARSGREGALLAQLLLLARAGAASEDRYYPTSEYLRAGGARPESVVLPGPFLDPILPQLAETGRLGLRAEAGAGSLATGEIEPRWLELDAGPPWQLRLALAPAPPGYELLGRFVRGDESLPIDGTDLLLPGFLVAGARLARADLWSEDASFAELGRRPLRIPARELDQAVERLVSLPLAGRLELAPEVPWKEVTAGEPVPRLRFARRGPEERELRALLDFRYGDVWLECEDPAFAAADRGARTLQPRNLEAETQALETLAGLGFRPPTPRRGWASAGWQEPGLALSPAAFEAAVSDLLDKGWIVEAEGARLRRPGRSSVRVASGIDYFDLEGAVDFDGESVPFPVLLAALREDEDFVRLGDGSRGLFPRAWLARCAALAGLGEETESGALRFARAQVGVVDALLSVQDEAVGDPRFAELRRRLARLEGIEPASEPAGFCGTLRTYQREGLGWLRCLESFGLGGCLADDMGLGKTIQVLAFLAGREDAEGRRAPSLVVAPRSVLHNWQEEAGRFAPSLRVAIYHGAGRAGLRERFDDFDLVVTTYATLRRDLAALGARVWRSVVLDEAQAIKNAASQTARAARELRADHRLALTGTPVENHLGELASLLSFLNPGLLGRGERLKALLGSAASPEGLALLARALRPFLLRRTKAQVLPELPPKTEQTLWCELSAGERRLYDELRRHYQATLLRRVERDGLERSKLHVLEALLRLRQAACHPGLLDSKRAGEPSAKLALLAEQLEEVLAEGHKALVFSQFTSLLALVRRALDGRHVPFAYLDGRTRDRTAQVERFQEDPGCRVFLVSLKAGGIGLNLTAADYVFLLDPWWNPAVEAQAVDRAHRIGQARPVMAYRLVAAGTVEEKILQLQETKRELAEAIFGASKSLIGKLTAEDLALLLG